MDLDRALRKAVREVVDFLVEEKGLTLAKALSLAGVAVDFRAMISKPKASPRSSASCDRVGAFWQLTSISNAKVYSRSSTAVLRNPMRCKMRYRR